MTERDVRIEYPATGATYTRRCYGVYEYSTYPRTSVLAGQTRRVWLDEFRTLAAAQAAFPTAHVVAGSCFAPPDLSHLPEEDDDAGE